MAKCGDLRPQPLMKHVHRTPYTAAAVFSALYPSPSMDPHTDTHFSVSAKHPTKHHATSLTHHATC
jgi:hypothetical protein